MLFYLKLQPYKKSMHIFIFMQNLYPRYLKMREGGKQFLPINIDKRCGGVNSSR